MPDPFLLLPRLALLACATSSLVAEGTLALATPTTLPAGAALELNVRATGTAPGARITWTLTLLPAPPAVGGGIQFLCGVGARIPFVAPAQGHDAIVEIRARAGDAAVTRQIRVTAGGTAAPAQSALPPPRVPTVRLAVGPAPSQVFPGTLVVLKAQYSGAPRHMRPHWRVDRMPLAPFDPPVCIDTRFGPGISWTAPQVRRPTVFHITATLQEGLVTRTIRVLPAPARASAPDARPGPGGSSSSSASSSSSSPDASDSVDGPDLPAKRARGEGQTPPPPPPPPRSTNLDSLPSVLHKLVHSFDHVGASGKVSRALGLLARANAEELAITNPDPQVDLVGRIASSPSLKRIRFRHMTGVEGRRIADALAACPGLTHLSLDASCAVSPDELAAIGRTHPRLVHLVAEGRQVSSAALQSGFRNLRRLELRDGPAELDLRGLVGLRTLKWQRPAMTPGSVDGARLPASLRALQLSGHALTGSPLPSGLTDLRLSQCSGPVALSGLTRLQTLGLNDLALEPGHFRLADVARANPELTSLDTNLQVENGDIDSLPAGLTLLQVRGSGLAAPPNFIRFHSLERLHMTHAAQFNAALLPGSLRRLTLADCMAVDWRPLAAIPLTHLQLDSPRSFTFDHLNPALTDLTIEAAKGATIIRMTRALPALVHLRNLKFTLFKGSVEIDPACFQDHPTLQRAETQRNLGTLTRIWNRPAPPGSGPRADAADPEALPPGPRG